MFPRIYVLVRKLLHGLLNYDELCRAKQLESELECCQIRNVCPYFVQKLGWGFMNKGADLYPLNVTLSSGSEVLNKGAATFQKLEMTILPSMSIQISNYSGSPLPCPLLPSPLEVGRLNIIQIRLGSLGERYQLPQQGLGRVPSGKRI